MEKAWQPWIFPRPIETEGAPRQPRRPSQPRWKRPWRHSRRSARTGPSRRSNARPHRARPGPQPRDLEGAVPPSFGIRRSPPSLRRSGTPEVRTCRCSRRSRRRPVRLPGPTGCRPRWSRFRGCPESCESRRPQWKASRTLGTLRGQSPEANSEKAICCESSWRLPGRAVGAPIEICSARAPIMRARSKRVYGMRIHESRAS